MATQIKWRTESITALPPGLSVTLRDGDEESTWPAVALLHQTADENGESVERIMLGMLNPYRGEVEALDVDDDTLAEFVCINLDGVRLHTRP